MSNKKGPLAHESSASWSAGLEWDTTIKVGDFVCLNSDGATPHVYEVRECYERVIMDHELHSSPHLLSRGFQPGQVLPSSLVIRRVRDAPGYHETPARRTIERKVDALAVTKVTQEQIQTVITNLSLLADKIRERNPE